MLSVKEEVFQVASRLSATATLDDAMYQLYILDQIAKGEDEVARGKIMTVDELEGKLKQW